MQVKLSLSIASQMLQSTILLWNMILGIQFWLSLTFCGTSNINFSDSVKKKLNVDHTSLSSPESFQFSVKRFTDALVLRLSKKFNIRG